MNPSTSKLVETYPLINSGKIQPSARTDPKLAEARRKIADAKAKAEEDVFAVLLGNMLGDCSLRNNPKSNEACLQFEWGNKAYAHFIYNVLIDYVLSPPREQVRINAFGNSVLFPNYHTSITCGVLSSQDKIKTVPAGLILNLVSALTLAIWYMDDGGLTDYRESHGQGIQLHTQGFTVRRVEQMSAELNEKFGFGCWVRLVKKGQPIICLPSRTYPEFYNLVKDYIHPSMADKLPLLK